MPTTTNVRRRLDWACETGVNGFATRSVPTRLPSLTIGCASTRMFPASATDAVEMPEGRVK